MKEITVDATIKNVETVTLFIEEQLEAMDFPMKQVIQINIAIDELFSNIANYAYPDGNGQARICIEPATDPEGVWIHFHDWGTPYDPTKKEDPDVTLSVADRQIGGLGIFIVKKSMDDVQYERKDNQNILSIRKNKC